MTTALTKTRRSFGAVALLASAALWVVTTVCFLGAWDQVAAVTTFPQWSWAMAGILVTCVGWWLVGNSQRTPLLLLGLWFLTTLYFADNLISVLRSLTHRTAVLPGPEPGTLRVVTLNCASSAAAAAEITRFKPDLVLLQEIPPSNEVARLGREWFGETSSSVAGWDCAIVSRFLFRASEDGRSAHHSLATVQLPTGQQVIAISLRLTPPLGRADLWNPAAWHSYAEDRRLRRKQLETVLGSIPRSAAELPSIIGGDFNAPVHDGVYRLLAGFQDSHTAAGWGWDNTAPNDMPLFRPDQVWLKGLSPISSHAVRTRYSDHRIVVVDCTLADQRTGG